MEGYIHTAPGISLWYEVHGSGRDTLIVPFASVMSRWLEPLTQRHTIILYDMRSRGRSPTVSDSTRFGIDQEIQDLDAVRGFFHIDRATIVGFSYLGAIAALYGARHPEHVARLVLIAPLAPTAGMVQAAQSAGSRHLDTGQVTKLMTALGGSSGDANDEALCQEFWRTFLPLYVSSTGRPQAEQVMFATCGLPNESPRRFLPVLQTIFRSAGDWNWTDQARAVRAPTLIVQGDSDFVAPAASGRAWAVAIRDSRLLIIAGGGHMMFTEFPESILRAIESFVAGAWPTESHPVAEH